MELLDYIGRNPGQTRSEIAEGTGMTFEAVSKATKILAGQSMVKATGDGKGRVEKRWYAVGKPAAAMGNAPMFRRVSSIFEVRP
jgi:DNA-binding IclR family transcriptional regulator